LRERIFSDCDTAQEALRINTVSTTSSKPHTWRHTSVLLYF
jgi:hypothetical protein